MKKVLITDDSMISRRKLKNMLNETGTEILEAENGVEALEIIENNPVDLIFLDLLMPEKDGFEVLKALQDKNIKIPVVVVSADIQESTKNLCLELGAVEFLNKPPKKSDLINSLQKALDNSIG